MTPPFIRSTSRSPTEPIDVAAAIRAALDRDGEVQFLDEVDGCSPILAFTLRRSGIALHVVDLDGSHLATYADSIAAVRHGYQFTDRAACIPPPPRARRRSPAMRGRATR